MPDTPLHGGAAHGLRLIHFCLLSPFVRDFQEKELKAALFTDDDLILVNEVRNILRIFSEASDILSQADHREGLATVFDAVNTIYIVLCGKAEQGGMLSGVCQNVARNIEERFFCLDSKYCCRILFAKVGIDGKGFHMFCGAITLTIDGNGCTIGIGVSSAVINGDGLTFEAEGWAFKVGKDGPSIKNDNAPLDLAQYGCTIPCISLPLPALPKIPPPPMPPVPKAIPGMPSLPSHLG